MRKKVDLSIVITFHSEGLLAHKTLRNMLASAKRLAARRISYEIIAHVDNGDEATLGYLKSHKKQFGYTLYQNTFKNPSDSRNFAVSKANGTYVALVDGDDIHSLNWLVDGVTILRKRAKEDLVLHVEDCVSFGDGQTPQIWHMTNSRSLEEDTIILLTRNRWCASTIAKREIYLKHPYRRALHGFGYEDWVFNCDTRHDGIRHEVVPGSIKFYRVKNDSVYKMHCSEHVVTDYSEMFDTTNLQKNAQNLAPETATDPKSEIILPAGRRVIKKAYDLAGQMPGVRNAVWKRLTAKTLSTIDNLGHLIQNAEELNDFDGNIYFDKGRIDQISTYSSEYHYLGEIYCRLISKMRRNPDYVFLPPVLNIGGTEKTIVNYLHAFKEIHPDWHIVVLASLPEKHPYDTPDNVDFLDFYGITKGLPDYDVQELLSRFIINTHVKRLHVIHNDVGYRWIMDHKTLLVENDYKVYASQYMHEYTKNPRLKIGFLDPQISESYPALTAIFSDNSNVLSEMEERHGFDPKKLCLHRQPIEVPPLKLRHKLTDSGKTRILWASRVSEQKRPDILKEIVKRLDPQDYQVDIYGRYQAPYNSKYFSGCPAAKYHGSYNGLDSLQLDQYDIFLYTSQTDGMPNVLLEIASKGLPIIASDVGGVSDLVKTGKTGVLVPFEDIDAYIKAIERLAGSRTLRNKYTKKAYEDVKNNYTWKQFLRSARRDIG